MPGSETLRYNPEAQPTGQLKTALELARERSEAQVAQTSPESATLKTASQIAQERTAPGGDLGPQEAKPESAPLKSALDIAKERSGPGGDFGPEVAAKAEENIENLAENPKKINEELQKIRDKSIKERENKESLTKFPEIKVNFEKLLNDKGETKKAKEVLEGKGLLLKILEFLKELYKLLTKNKEEKAEESQSQAAKPTEKSPIIRAESEEKNESTEKLSGEKLKDFWKAEALKNNHIGPPAKGEKWLEAGEDGEPTGKTMEVLDVDYNQSPPRVLFKSTGTMKDGRTYTRQGSQEIGSFMGKAFNGEIEEKMPEAPTAVTAKPVEQKVEPKPEENNSSQEKEEIETAAKIAQERSGLGGSQAPEVQTSLE
jgi:hypothetical protein